MAVKEITGAEFEEEVIKSDVPVIVDFKAEWCGPCKVLKSTVEEIAEERADVKVVSVDIDEEEDLVDEYEVFSIPCLVAFKGGSEVGRSIGLASKSEIYGALGL